MLSPGYRSALGWTEFQERIVRHTVVAPKWWLDHELLRAGHADLALLEGEQLAQELVALVRAELLQQSRAVLESSTLECLGSVTT